MLTATPSVLLRRWRDQDLEPYTAMNADPEVMRYFPKCATEEESRQSFARVRAGLEQRGWGLWALEVDGAFAGFVGLSQPSFTAHFTPCVEIGWRLRREFWGRSIAYCAAVCVEAFAFRQLKLAELVSFTSVINTRSRRLMERLGFSRNPAEDFLHPTLPVDSPLRPHVLYRKPNKGTLAEPELPLQVQFERSSLGPIEQALSN